MPENFLNRYTKQIDFFIDQALAEDLGEGDHSTLSCIDPQSQSTAQLLVKQNGRIAGLTLAQLIFSRYDSQLHVELLLKEGSLVKKGDLAFRVHGPTQSILSTERLVLNTMQRMSGIATLTHRLNQKIKHTSCTLLDTRKTSPNFRYPEKWAVQIGGGSNHRMGLFDAIMIKDNHIDYCGGVSQALQKTTIYLDRLGTPLDVIVECRNQEEIKAALPFPCVNRILLDNFSPEELKKAVALIDGKKDTEASGNITEKNLEQYAVTGVNYLSLGALTYDAKSMDLSLKAL